MQHHFIPNNGMQQIYAIQPQQQMAQQMGQPMPQPMPQPISTHPFTMNMGHHQSFAPNTNQYQAHTSYGPPPQALQHQHYTTHAPQQSINGIPYMQTYAATSPVDNYSIYNGSVYNVAANNNHLNPNQATPHAPPPSVVSNATQTNQNQYQQMMAMRNAQAQAFRKSMNMRQQQLKQQHAQQQIKNANNNNNQPDHNEHEHEHEREHEQEIEVEIENDNNNINNNNDNEEEKQQHQHKHEHEQHQHMDDEEDDDDDNEQQNIDNDIEIDEEEDDGNDINDLLEGDAILAGEFVGIIRYLGPLFLNPFNTSETTKEQYIGIECSSETETDGKGHDGWFKDFRYFKTKNGKNTGLLIESTKFSKKLSPFRLLQTIKKQKNATDQLQNAMQSLKTQNKLLKLNLEALLLQQHKMKQFFAKFVTSKNGTFNSTDMAEITEINPLPMLARKSNNNEENNTMSRKQRRKSQTLIDNNKHKKMMPTEINADINNSRSQSQSVTSDLTPITPEPLKGIRQRSNHTAEATMELSIHLDRLDPDTVSSNIPAEVTPTDRMLDQLQNTQGLSHNEVVGGSAKHLDLRPNNASVHTTHTHTSNGMHEQTQLQMGHSSHSILNNSEYHNSEPSIHTQNTQRSIQQQQQQQHVQQQQQQQHTPPPQQQQQQQQQTYYVDNNNNGYNHNPQYVEQMSQQELLSRGMTQSSFGTSMGTPTPAEYNSNTPQLQQNVSSTSGFPQYQPQTMPDPYTIPMNGQYYTTATGPYGYNPTVIQESAPQQHHYYTSEAAQNAHNAHTNRNNNTAHHPQYSIEMMANAHYANKGYNGYNTIPTAASPGIDSNRSGYSDRYSQFLKKLVVAPQPSYNNNYTPQQQQQLQLQAQQQQQQALQHHAQLQMNMGHPNDADDEQDNQQQQQNIQNMNEEPQQNMNMIDDMDDDGIIRGTPGATPVISTHDGPVMDDNTPIDEDILSNEEIILHNKSSRSSREHRTSYTGSASSNHLNKKSKNKNKNKNKKKQKSKNKRDKNYGLHPKGIRMANQYNDQSIYAVDHSDQSNPDKSPNDHAHRSNHSGGHSKSKKNKKSKNRSNNKRERSNTGGSGGGHGGGHQHQNQWYSPSNSVHSSPITKRRRKYNNNNNNNQNSNHNRNPNEGLSDSNSENNNQNHHNGYPNTYNNSIIHHNEYSSEERRGINNEKSKRKKNKKGLKMKNIRMNKKNNYKTSHNNVSYSPPLSHSKIKMRGNNNNNQYRNYINIDTPTATSLSATISASNIINLDKYQKPQPLPVVNNNNNNKYTERSERERLLLKDQDTLSNGLQTTHKTVDLPSPQTRHRNNKKKKKKKKYKNKNQNMNYNSSDADDDDEMQVLANYDAYNSITQTEDESPEPMQSNHKKHTQQQHGHANDNKIINEMDEMNEINEEEKLNINKRKLELLNKASAESRDGETYNGNENEFETQEEITTECTDEHEHEFGDEATDNICELTDLGLAPSSKTSTLMNTKNRISNQNPRFSTLSIDSEFQNDNAYDMVNGMNDMNDLAHNLIIEDESLMDDLIVSPRFKNSKIIEFYVPKNMSNEQIRSCFGLYTPIKIIPHEVLNHELQGNNKKIEAIFEDNETATKAVQMLKHQNLQVVFKKSPRQTLVSNNRQTPILQPISSQGPFNSFATHAANNKNKLHLVSNDSVSTAGGQEDKIHYRPHRVGQIQQEMNDYENGDNENNNMDDENDRTSYEWTEESSNDNSSNDDDDESQVWALEQGFSASSDDESNQNSGDSNDNDNDNDNRNIVSN